jgi:hypothetical protein
VPAQCATCDAPTGDGTSLCNRCVKDLRRDVESAIWLDAELETTYLRQGRFTRATDGSRSTTAPLPYNERAGAMRIDLNATLNAWSLKLAQHDEDTRDPLVDVPASSTSEVARWLLRNLVALRTHPDAALGFRELTNTIGAARAVVDRPPDLLAYGICGNNECPAFLYAAPGKKIIVCKKCRAEHQASDRREWMLNYVRARWGPASEVATYLRAAGVKVTAERIRKMGERGRIPVDSKASPNRYRVGDVLDAMATNYPGARRGPRL